MFKFISDALDAQAPRFEDDTDVPASVVTEYAHMFQELADLTPEGTEANVVRKTVIDIPLDDDIEINTLELNIGDGRITDIPADAAIEESFNESLKSIEDFYQEAVDSTKRFERETESQFTGRCQKKADSLYAEYKVEMENKGLFGFGKIKINDVRVPTNVMVNFGMINDNRALCVPLRVLFQVDKKDRILKKQLDTVEIIRKSDFSAMAEVLGDIIKRDWPDEIEKVKDSIYDIATPSKLYVPVDPIDAYTAIFLFDADFSDDGIWIRFTKKMNSSHSITAPSLDLTDIPKFAKSFIDKRSFIKESYTEKLTRHPDRFGVFQEAIDFGEAAPQDGDTSTELPEIGTDPQDGPELSVSAGETPTPETTPQDGEKKELAVDKNDVSDQIADKVTANEPAAVDGDTPSDVEAELGDAATGSDSGEMEPIDNTGDTDPDAALDDLSKLNGEDGTTSDPIDFDNMSIDDMIEQGAEKLKSLPIDQLKAFLTDGAVPSVQESFFLTKSNINKELDVTLRKCLGILNDDKMKLDELLQAFKAAGKKLNRALSKAGKMKKVYSEEEVGFINKLNKVLIDLSGIISSTKDSNYEATIKRLISAFVSQAAVVGEIVEKHAKNADKPVQESTVDEMLHLNETKESEE